MVNAMSGPERPRSAADKWSAAAAEMQKSASWIAPNACESSGYVDFDGGAVGEERAGACQIWIPQPFLDFRHFPA